VRPVPVIGAVAPHAADARERAAVVLRVAHRVPGPVGAGAPAREVADARRVLLWTPSLSPRAVSRVNPRACVRVYTRVNLGVACSLRTRPAQRLPDRRPLANRSHHKEIRYLIPAAMPALWHQRSVQSPVEMPRSVATASARHERAPAVAVSVTRELGSVESVVAKHIMLRVDF